VDETVKPPDWANFNDDSGDKVQGPDKVTSGSLQIKELSTADLVAASKDLQFISLAHVHNQLQQEDPNFNLLHQFHTEFPEFDDFPVYVCNYNKPPFILDGQSLIDTRLFGIPKKIHPSFAAWCNGINFTKEGKPVASVITGTCSITVDDIAIADYTIALLFPVGWQVKFTKVDDNGIVHLSSFKEIPNDS